MLTAIGQIIAALGAIAGLAAILYQTYWAPKAKARRQAAADGKKAAENLNSSAVTAAFDKLRKRKNG